MSFPADVRARRDLVTNPAFSDVNAVIEEMVRLETVKLTNDAKGTELDKVNFQAGMLEGIRRVQMRLGSYREDALSDFHTENGPEGP